MDLFTATARIKKALSSKDYISELTHYHLRDGRAYACNGSITASAPISEPLEYVIPADAFDKALTILGKEAEFKWAPDKLTVKKDRRRMEIRLLQPKDVTLIEPARQKHVVTARFTEALRRIRPFISEDASRPWALVAWLHRGPEGKHVVTATNNITVVEIDVEDTASKDDLDCQIPNFAIDYILDRNETVTHVAFEETRASFYFDDGSELTSQLFAVKMPQQVTDIIKDCYTVDKNFLFELRDEWRKAYSTIIQLSPEELRIDDAKMTASKEQALLEVDVVSPMPDDTAFKASVWNPKFLSPVVHEASHIQFSAYPAPAKFVGDKIRGLMVGKVV